MRTLFKFFALSVPFILLLSSSMEGIAQSERSEQEEDKNLIQFSGVVVRNDSLTPIPFTNLSIKDQGRGTMADAQGYFSLVAQENDTIVFSAIGYKKNSFVIPDSLEKSNYSLIHSMELEKDTVQKKETPVYPWPTKEQFKEAFMNVDLPDDDIQRARKNLAEAEMRERMKKMEMDASLNFDQEMQEHQNRVYYAGQAPPMSILNPSAWAEFIQAWREGRFTDQGEE